MVEQHTSESDTKLHVKCQEADTATHPQCAHGPTILFYHRNESDGFFACAALRKSGCSFHQKAVTVKSNQTQTKYEPPPWTPVDESSTQYCLSCNELLGQSTKTHKAPQHNCIKLSKEMRADPTSFLPALANDAEHAQYFFDDKALEFFVRTFKDLGISKVICMGAPRLHGYIRTGCSKIESYLLDFDRRFMYFYGAHECAWYNMCNNHFFYAEQRVKFEAFLRGTSEERVLLFTDPPFACRTEPVAHTLRQLTQLYNTINKLPHQPLPIFWIFPYYSAQYIQQQMSEMSMCEYKINYTNHVVYTDVGRQSRKLGSPVRVFTNVPLQLLQLPADEGYKYCAKCTRYTAPENIHCDACGVCPSKNGASYRHCTACGTCVKPSYVHCYNCRRCTQKVAHTCSAYRAQQHCWICRQHGHTELYCETWSALARKNSRLKCFLKLAKNAVSVICLLCGGSGHNESHCKRRAKYLRETTFMGSKNVKSRLRLHK